MKTESLEYRDGDVTLRGFLAFDDKKSGRRPGVLVMPGPSAWAHRPNGARSGWPNSATSRWPVTHMVTVSS
jgi:hypothetical protein